MMDNTTEKTVDHHYDVLVIGAGLVGACFAALLNARVNESKTRLPLSIGIIDGGGEPKIPDLDQQPPIFDPRVVALTHASEQLFESLGLWSSIKSQRACAYHHMHVWDDEGTASIDFSAQEIQQTHLGHIVENNILQSTVHQLISDKANISLWKNTKVIALQEGNNSTTIECLDGKTISADLIVAADGAQSKIRELISLPIREWDYQHKAIVATVTTKKSHGFTAWQNFLSTGPLAFLPLGDGSENYCSIVWSVEPQIADELMALEDAIFCERLATAFDYRLGEVKAVSKRFCFPLKQRHAINYYHNSIVFIGDAAHTIHPLAGQGVNLGLLDVNALVEEIDRAVNRDLPVNDASLLRRYQRIRKPHNLEVMLLMESLKRLFSSRQLWVRWLRNTGLKKVNEFSLLKNWLAKQAVNNG